MKKNLLIGTIAVFGTTLSLAQSISPLELKEMQTRKFVKPFNEVMTGIKSFCEDTGAQHAIPSLAQVVPDSVSRHPGLKSHVGSSIVKELTCFYSPKITVGIFTGIRDENKHSQIKAELVRADEDGAVIRLRLYKGFPQEQITDAAAYSDAFKMIGNSLFIQAININPAEQQ